MDLHYKTLGEGEPLIILHGLFGMLDNWQAVAKELSKNYMVYLLDLRNHGKSPHSKDWNISLMAEDVLRFMENNWIFETYLMGHSMGGKVAMEVALQSGDFVKKLIVVDIAPKAYEPGHDSIFRALQPVPIESLSSRKEVESYLEQHIGNPGIRQFLMKNIQRNKEGNFKWKMNLPVIYSNYHEILKEISNDQPFEKPTLFLGGEHSDYIQTDDIPLIKEIFPKAIIKKIPKAGHWVHADQKDMLIDTVIHFLGD